MLNSRAIAYYQQGWYSVAVDLAEDALEFAEKAFGSDHPKVAESLNNLALIYYTQGKETEASIFDPTSTQIREERLLQSDSDTSQYVNKVVLLNLAKRKYSLAESLFRQALEIKKNALGQEHSELLPVLANLVDLHSTRGKCAEAESYLKSLRMQDNKVLPDVRVTDAEQEDPGYRDLQHKRESMRCRGHFPAKLVNEKTGISISGVTENISQVGTFIKTRNWRAFRADDQVSLAISLPSIFPDQTATIDMEGSGIIARVDEENEGVAIQFMRNFRQFKRVAGTGETEVAGKIRYKKLAQYIQILEDTSLTDFLDRYPRGFLVERYKMDFDGDVIFQFSTKQIDIAGLLNAFSNEFADTDFLKARVIEISKKRIGSNEGVINIGRSPNNDIVLYNKAVSKSHALIHFPTENGPAHLTDLQSTNYTFLNNEKIAPYMTLELTDGDEISFGPQTKVFYFSTETFYDLVTSLKHSHEGKMGS